MNITVPIPDEIAERLGADGRDLERLALEAFALAEYSAGTLTAGELRRVLGFGTRVELDGFLKERGLYLEYDLVELDRERRDLARLGY